MAGKVGRNKKSISKVRTKSKNNTGDQPVLGKKVPTSATFTHNSKRSDRFHLHFSAFYCITDMQIISKGSHKGYAPSLGTPLQECTSTIKYIQKS